MNNHERELKIFHEIKNSTTIIECSLKLIERNHPEVAGFEFWSDIMDEFQYLRNMVGIFSNYNNKDLSLKKVTVDSVLDSVVRAIRPITTDTGFSCQYIITENLPFLLTDGDKLKSCILNIIKNAYDAMGKTGTVFVHTFEENGQVRIDIQDFGGGIPKELESRIFDAYYTSKSGGSGLGLTITKQIITELGGEILYTSRPGDGCTFSLLLPAFVENKHSV